MKASLAHMKRVTVTELKNKLSQYLRLVKRGETIEVLEHSVPIARLQGMGAGVAGGDKILSRLVRDGVVSRARKKARKEFLKEPAVACAVDPVKIIIEERGDR